VPIPTYPASAFVSAGGITLLLDHVTEYELTDGELALTVLRSTGLISRNDHPWREDPAGPSLPIPAAQLRGPWSFSFAYYPGTEGALEQAERYRHPFMTAAGGATVNDLRAQAGPELNGENVVLTALQPTLARIVNMSDATRTATFDGESHELRAWEIRTLKR
jgi:alpha-mannosidase